MLMRQAPGARALMPSRAASLLFATQRTAIAAAPASLLACSTTTTLAAQSSALRLLARQHSSIRSNAPIRLLLAGPRRAPVVSRFSSTAPPVPPAPPSNSATGVVGAPIVKPQTHFERLKDLWRKYGIVAIGTYLSMYGIVLGSMYVAIDQGWVNTKKSRNPTTTTDDDDDDFNLVTTTNRFVKLAEDLGIAKYLEVERVNAKTGTFLIAWVATKFTEPLRLALTLAITPRIARFFGRAPARPLKIKVKTTTPKP